MTVTTDRGRTFPVDWMWARSPAELMLQLRDDRPLHEIAADFEDCPRLERLSDTEGNITYEGYRELRAIKRERDGAVLLTLSAEVSP